MFYNALKRKGWETEGKDVEAMVQVHNWLNEAVWDRVRDWESLHHS
jgi:cytochrome c heme-lyase